MYYNNANESLNNLLKEKGKGRKTTIFSFSKHMAEISKSMEMELKLAFLGRGNKWVLENSKKHLEIDPCHWSRLNSSEREALLNKLTSRVHSSKRRLLQLAETRECALKRSSPSSGRKPKQQKRKRQYICQHSHDNVVFVKQSDGELLKQTFCYACKLIIMKNKSPPDNLVLVTKLKGERKLAHLKCGLTTKLFMSRKLHICNEVQKYITQKHLVFLDQIK